MRPVEWNKICRKDWLKNMPELIYKLANEYGFYYNKLYNKVNDINTIIAKNDKKGIRSRINVCYECNNTNAYWYLVVYTKKRISVYKCLEYKLNENYANIKRFIKKFSDAYEKGKEDRFEREINSV